MKAGEAQRKSTGHISRRFAGSIPASRAICALLCICITGCQTLATLQQNPAVEAAEQAAITIGLDLATGSPAFGFVAPLAVSGLTAIANNVGTKTAITGDITKDAPLITATVQAAIPTSAGTTAAAQIAAAYTTAMVNSGAPQTTSSGNVILAAISAGLNAGASK